MMNEQKFTLAFSEEGREVLSVYIPRADRSQVERDCQALNHTRLVTGSSPILKYRVVEVKL